MKRKISLFMVLTLLLSQLAFPIPTSQAAASVVSSPGLTKQFEMPGVGPGGNFSVFGFMPDSPSDPVGQEYTITFQADSKPMMVVGFADIQSWSYNDSNNQLTVVAKSIKYFNEQGQEIDRWIMIAFGSPPTNDGPPSEAQGMFISTNANDWDMRPSEDYDGDKRPDSLVLKITGKTGTRGFFKIFWPTALLNKMGLTADTIAGFIEGDRVDSTTTELDGGVLVQFNVVFNSGGVSATSKLRGLANTTIKVAAGKASAISLNANKISIKKKQAVTLYGYVSPKKRLAKVDLYRKYQGESRYKKIATVRTDKNGRYSRIDKPKKTATYIAKYKKGRKLVASSSEKVVVK